MIARWILGGKIKEPSLRGLGNQGRNGKQVGSPDLELRPRGAEECSKDTEGPVAKLAQRVSTEWQLQVLPLPWPKT